MCLLVALLAFVCAWPARALEGYGAKGIFPVYEANGQWVIFDKKPPENSPDPLAPGQRFLTIGSAGAQVFEVKRDERFAGGACRAHKPASLRAALLVGPRRLVGRPIIAVHVPPRFSLKGSRAAYARLNNEVSEQTYARLGNVLRAAIMRETPQARPEQIQTKIDFGATLQVSGLGQAFVFVEESQVGESSKRCLRLAADDKLIGSCAEMPRALLAETALLQFVAYDPSGRGNPFLLAFTKTAPLWGEERWGFVIRAGGPRLFLFDALDPKCRAGF